MSGAYLIVGLGNPGSGYARNRHNAGYLVADELARRCGVTFTIRRPIQALISAVRLGLGPGGAPGPRAVLAKPTSFMNVSGGPVKALASYYGVEASDVIVVHDDLDLPFGALKLKRGGGEGGHNGLRDITKALATPDYIRVRLGIGRPPGRMEAADYVLADFLPAERPTVAAVVGQAADAVEQIATQGLDAAQLQWHTKSE